MSTKSFEHFMMHVANGRNGKLARFSDAQFRALVQGVLPIAAEATIRGTFMIGDTPATAEDVAFKAPKVSKRVAQSAIELMRSLGMLEFDDEISGEWVHDWHEHNPAPKTDRTATERQRRKREKERASRPVTAASRRDVTVGHGDVTPTEKEKERDSSSTKNSSVADAPTEKVVDPEHLRLSHLLAELMLANDDRVKVDPDGKRWLDAIRLLNTADKRTVAEIEQVIRWSQADEFWKANIHSAPTLREKFPKLLAKSGGRGGLRAVPAGANAAPLGDTVGDDFVARMNAGRDRLRNDHPPEQSA